MSVKSFLCLSLIFIKIFINFCNLCVICFSSFTEPLLWVRHCLKSWGNTVYDIRDNSSWNVGPLESNTTIERSRQISILACQIGIAVIYRIILVKCGIFLCTRKTASVNCSCSILSSIWWENAAAGMQAGVGCLFHLGAHGPRLLYQQDDSASQPSQHWRLHWPTRWEAQAF